MRYRARHQKKSSIFKKILLFLGLILFVFASYTVYNFYNSAKNSFNEVNNTIEVDPNFNKFSVLIMGIDENESRKLQGQTRENSRTDSIIYMAANKDKKRLDMVSIPRDSLTLMTDEKRGSKSRYFFDKITHAHAYNKEEGTIDAVSNLLNVDINFYVVINFAAFEDVVNSLGGLDLYVPFDMIEQNANGEQGKIVLKKGWQKLNGAEALAFSRSRYYDSDIERGQRQLQVIHAAIDKAKSLNVISKINELIKIGGNNVTHNMTPKQIVSALTILGTGDMEVVSHRLGGYDATLNGIYYYYPKPSHLLYISSVLNNLLDKPFPNSKDIINIYYQGYITPLQKNYTKNVDSKKQIVNLAPARYFNFSVEDNLINLPIKLDENDLLNDPTVSNENKPTEDTKKETNN